MCTDKAVFRRAEKAERLTALVKDNVQVARPNDWFALIACPHVFFECCVPAFLLFHGLREVAKDAIVSFCTFHLRCIIK